MTYPNTIRFYIGNTPIHFYFEITITKFHNYGNYYNIYKTLCACYVETHTSHLRHSEWSTSKDNSTRLEIVVIDNNTLYLDITHLGTSTETVIEIVPHGFGFMDVEKMEGRLITKKDAIDSSKSYFI